jgi:hypothetical protein
LATDFLMLFRTVILVLLLTIGLQSPQWAAAAAAKPAACGNCCAEMTGGRKHCPNCPPACVAKCGCFIPAEPMWLSTPQLVVFAPETISIPPTDDGYLAARTDDPLIPPPKFL